MHPHRKAAIIIGILYIIGTVAGILSVVVSAPVLDAPDYLARIAADGSPHTIGALLVLTMGLALALVPVVLYPIARRHSEALALGYVVFRGALESVAYVVIVISWLALVAVGRSYGQGAADASAAQAMGDVLLAARDGAGNVLPIVFGLGALMLYTLLYQSRLVPRWLSAWGVVAIIMHLATVYFVLFTAAGPMSPAMLVLHFPIFVQEMVMAAWLIIRGFSASAAEAASPGYGQL
jgi:hypothetical protein